MTSQGKRDTARLLADSFKELACRRPVEKITIKEITDRAGVIRPTFYNHFQDKYELLEWIISQDLIEPIRPFVRSGLTTQAMTFLFLNVEKEKEFAEKCASTKKLKFVLHLELPEQKNKWDAAIIDVKDIQEKMENCTQSASSFYGASAKFALECAQCPCLNLGVKWSFPMKMC